MTNVDLISNGNALPVLHDNAILNDALKLQTDALSRKEYDGIRSVGMDFQTPLRMKAKGDLITKLDFSTLFERLAHRLHLLSALYGNGMEIPDCESLYQQAKEIETVEDRMHWYEWERFSPYQNTSMRLGGLRGRIRFEGDLSPFMPYLELGEQVHVGINTSFGLGKYKMARLSS